MTSSRSSQSMQFCDIFIWMAPQIHYVSFLEFYNLHYEIDTILQYIYLDGAANSLCKFSRILQLAL